VPAGRLKLEPGERRVVVVRRHVWLLLRSLLGLIPLFAVLPFYAAVEYIAPQADLARYQVAFLWADLGLSGVYILKWLAADFAAWYAGTYTITNRRIIEQQGVWLVERREASLRAVQEADYTISGAEARFFNYGDLKLQTGTRGKGLVFQQVPRPRQLQTLISAQARAAREEWGAQADAESSIHAALQRVFRGSDSLADAPTTLVPVVTRLAKRARRRLSLLPNEGIIYSSHKHPLLLARALAPPLLLLAAVLAVLILARPQLPLVLPGGALFVLLAWSAWAFIDWRDDLYVLTSERLIQIRRSPLVFELRKVVQLRAIQDVVLRLSLPAGQLFSIGSLTIELGGAEPLQLTAVPRPERLQRLIFETIDATLARDRLREQERLAGTLTEWFKEYHRMQSNP
jgi:uncharacterized membrane protein YdbT with pleckstrin-like domain